MKKLLSLLFSVVVMAVIGLSFVFIYSYFNEADATLYPDKISVEQAVIGPANRVTMSDFIIWNWAKNPDDGVSASKLPKEIITKEVSKCSKAETVLVCMFENRCNAKVCLRKTDYSEENMKFCTNSAKYVELFSKSYLLLECSDESEDDPTRLVYVLYEFEDDMSALFDEFETSKEYYYKTFPLELVELSLDYGKMICLVGVSVIVFIILFILNGKLIDVLIRLRGQNNKGKKQTGDGLKPLKKSD